MDKSIVVIDDEQGVLDVLCDLFAMEGLPVLCFDRPEQAEAMDAGTDPCLFLIDIMLPGTSGIELAQHLRDQRFRDTPMIAMSASDFMVRTAEDTGLFQEAIRKPFDVDTVLDTVERYLS